jgi:hypothetical protein
MVSQLALACEVVDHHWVYRKLISLLSQPLMGWTNLPHFLYDAAAAKQSCLEQWN